MFIYSGQLLQLYWDSMGKHAPPSQTRKGGTAESSAVIQVKPLSFS